MNFNNVDTRKFDFKTFRDAYKKIKDLKIDTLFFCIPGTPDFFSFILAAKLAKVKNIVMHVGAMPTLPFSINFDTLLWKIGRWQWRFYFTCKMSMKCISLALFNNPIQIEKFTKIFSFKNIRKELWWPPIDLDYFKFDHNIRLKMRKKYNVEDKIVFGTVGTLCSQKRQDLIIRAFKKLKQRAKNIKLFIVGTGEKFEEYKNLSLTLELNHDVIFLGERSNIPDLLNMFDVFVFSSSDLNETLGIAVLEAMSCGLPCIVSDLPGLKRIVENNYYGLIFQRNDVDDLVKKMYLLYKDKNLRYKYSNRSLVRSKICDKKNVIDHLLSLLN
ncbi:hypothetical protein TH606_09250 [Thermodesulfatator autotrophicus]|uniref:Glycosyl transferase family 1 domain-containing protein n=1 Tax=Thermodesulfatator autotrophicus TaxID=1795632 RepID=A0A177E4W3_9BACT|nr:hypothetical protein TH606_09250 [Thermodesulfatator autotrophicus]